MNYNYTGQNLLSHYICSFGEAFQTKLAIAGLTDYAWESRIFMQQLVLPRNLRELLKVSQVLLISPKDKS